MKSLPRQDMDKGYAWAILAACCLICILMGGSLQSFGVLYAEMLTFYGQRSGSTAWVGSIASFLCFASGPISAALSKRFSFRVVAFIGGLFFGTGYIASSFVSRMEILYVSYGVLSGIGLGLGFQCFSAISCYYFEERRAVANGIILACGGIGSFVLSYIYRFLIDKYSLHGALLIIGGMFLNVCVAACVFVQPNQLKVQHVRDLDTSVTDSLPKPQDNLSPKKSRNRKENKHLSFNFNLLKNPRFVLYLFSTGFSAFAFFNNSILIPAFLQDIGLGKTKGTIVLSIYGGAQAVGRILLGWFADQGTGTIQSIYIGATTFSSIVVVLPIVFQSYEYMIVYAVLAGLFSTVYITLMALLVIDIIGLDDLPHGLGFVFLSEGLVGLFANPLAGFLDDVTGDWTSSFILTAVALLLSGIILSFDNLVLKYYDEKPCDKMDETDVKPPSYEALVSVLK